MCCGSDLNSVWVRLPGCFSKGLQKRDFSDIYLTMVFGVRNFENTSAKRVIFFWKCSKFSPHVKNAEKNREKFFNFRNNCIWVGCVKLSLLKRDYFWPAVNMLKNSPKILPITKRHFVNINCLHSDQQIW